MTEMRFGVERLCVFGMPPAAFVEMTAAVGGASVGLGLAAMRYYNPHGYPDWSLRDDASLRRATSAALRATGIRPALMEGVSLVEPHHDAAARDLDIAAELGTDCVNLVDMSRDRAQVADRIAAVAAMARERGLQAVTEVGSCPSAQLDDALAMIAHAQPGDLELLIDTMHYFRFGGTNARIAALDPSLIGYVQLCDAPAANRFGTYMEEALHERMVPGSGALPLAGFLPLVPPGVTISVEIPQRSLAAAGVAPEVRVGACLRAAHHLAETAAGADAEKRQGPLAPSLTPQ